MSARVQRATIQSAISVGVNEVLSDVGSRHLREIDGCLVVEFGFGTATEIAEIYRAFAVRCIQNEVNRVLIKPGDDDPGGEHALRDAVTMMLLAGIAREFRIALYSADRKVEARYLLTVRDLRLANVNAMWFSNKGEAMAWLAGAGGHGRLAAQR